MSARSGEVIAAAWADVEDKAAGSVAWAWTPSTCELCDLCQLLLAVFEGFSTELPLIWGPKLGENEEMAN